VSQSADYVRARERLEGGGPDVAALEDMISLAVTGEGTIRRWAQEFLRARFNVIVVEEDHATQGKTGSFSG